MFLEESPRKVAAQPLWRPVRGARSRRHEDENVEHAHEFEGKPRLFASSPTLQVVQELRRERVARRTQEESRRGIAPSENNTRERKGRSDDDDDNDDEQGNAENNTDNNGAHAYFRGNHDVGVEGVPRATLDVEALFDD